MSEALDESTSEPTASFGQSLELQLIGYLEPSQRILLVHETTQEPDTKIVRIFLTYLALFFDPSNEDWQQEQNTAVISLLYQRQLLEKIQASNNTGSHAQLALLPFGWQWNHQMALFHLPRPQFDSNNQYSNLYTIVMPDGFDDQVAAAIQDVCVNGSSTEKTASIEALQLTTDELLAETLGLKGIPCLALRDPSDGFGFISLWDILHPSMPNGTGNSSTSIYGINSSFLDSILSSPSRECHVSLSFFLSVVQQLALILEVLHNSHVVYSALHPKNILLTCKPDIAKDPTGLGNWCVHILDMEEAVLIPKSGSYLPSVQLDASFLEYMSPEQSGRTKSLVDHRTDIYSLGIVCYEMLAGRLPFEADEPLHWVHAHLANKPMPLHVRNSSIPLPISKIVSKMLEKVPGARYQSARGIYLDIKLLLDHVVICAPSLKNIKGAQLSHAALSVQQTLMRPIDPELMQSIFTMSDSELEPLFKIKPVESRVAFAIGFKPGKYDIGVRGLAMWECEKIYGRENEVRHLIELLARFGDVNTTTSSSPSNVSNGYGASSVITQVAQCILVRGDAGTGKTRLLEEVFKTLSPASVIVARMECYPQSNQLPHSSIMGAFKSLVDTLTDMDTRIITQCKRALQGLSLDLRVVMINDLPDMQDWFDSLPDTHNNVMESLSLSGAEKSQSYVNAWAIWLSIILHESGLVLFFDNAQWMDKASRSLLSDITQQLCDCRLTVIISSRLASLEDSTIEFCKFFGLMSNIYDIHLADLGLQSVTAILSDTLHRQSKHVSELAEWITEKTGGNPAKITNILRELFYQDMFWLMETDDAVTAPSSATSRSGSTPVSPEKGYAQHYMGPRWDFSIKAIEGSDCGLNANAADTSLQKRRDFDSHCKSLLQQASCIGTSFDIEFLSIVSGIISKEALRHIWPAIEAGVLLVTDKVFRSFAPKLRSLMSRTGNNSTHGSRNIPDFDKSTSEGTAKSESSGSNEGMAFINARFVTEDVRQGFMLSMDTQSKQFCHLAIARHLNRAEQDALDDHKGNCDLFDCVYHYNEALENISRDELADLDDINLEYDTIAALNVRAGDISYQASAFESARVNYEIAKCCLMPHGDSLIAWEKYYEVMFNMSIKLAVIYSYLKQDSLFEQICAEVRHNAVSLDDKLSVQPIQFAHYQTGLRTKSAIDMLLNDLVSIGSPIAFDRHETMAAEIESLSAKYSQQDCMALIQQWTVGPRKKCRDLRTSTLLETLCSLQQIALFAGLTSVMSVAALRVLEICVKLDIFLYRALGAINVCTWCYIKANPISDINEFIQIWSELEENCVGIDTATRSTVRFNFVATMRPFLKLDDLQDRLSTIVSECLRTGVVAIAAIGLILQFETQLEWSHQLHAILKWAKSYQSFFQQCGAYAQIWDMNIFCIQKLTHSDDDNHVLHPTLEDSYKWLDSDGSRLIGLRLTRTCSLVASTILGDEKTLEQWADCSEKKASTSHFDCFYLGLAIASMVSNHQSAKSSLMCQMDVYISRMSTLAYYCPLRHAHKKFMLMGEKARIQGMYLEALSFYEVALKNAEMTGSLFHIALCHELTAKIWISKGITRYIVLSGKDCLQAYERFGAIAKVGQLRSTFAQYLETSNCESNESTRQVFGLELPAIETIARRTSRTFKISAPISTPYARPRCPDKSLQYFPIVTNRSKISRLLSRDRPGSGGAPASTIAGSFTTSLDVNTILRATQSISSETSLENVLKGLMHHSAVNAGATEAILVLIPADCPISSVSAEDLLVYGLYRYSDGAKESIEVMQEKRLGSYSPGIAPLTVISAALSSGSLVLDNALMNSRYDKDEYVISRRIRSVMCALIVQKGRTLGMMYLANDLADGIFNVDRVEVVKSLASSAAIAIENTRLQKANTELESALIASYTAKSVPDEATPRFNVDGPIRKAVDTLNSIRKKHPLLSKETDFILSLLLSGQSVFASNIDQIRDNSGHIIDSDTRDWIKTTMLSVPDDTVTLSIPETASPDTSASRLNNRSAAIDILYLQEFKILREGMDKAQSALSLCQTLEFDVFSFADITGHPLLCLGHHIIHEKLCLTTFFNIDVRRLVRFLSNIESAYRPVPYHSSKHGADVMQTLMCLLTSGAEHAFSPTEMLSALISAAIHDVDHPGVNNNFLIQTQSPLANLYSDQSVLEYHHCATAFDILGDDSCNVFHGLPNEKIREMRKLIIGMVLSTDMAKHFEYINKFKARFDMVVSPNSDRVETGILGMGLMKLETPADRAMALEVAIKAADLNNPTRPTDIAVRWTEAIMEEFLAQGDRERALNLPVSKFMDRIERNVAKCQIGFIDILVAPLFEAWMKGMGDNAYNRQCLENIVTNRRYWELQQANETNP